MATGTETATERRRLAEELKERFAGDPDAWTGDTFNDLALRAFRLQYEGSPAYGRFCRGRSRTPETVTRWQDVPLVPTSAFRHLDLFSGEGEPEAVFETSGTSRGREARGRHPVYSLDLYRAAALPWFRRHLLPDREAVRILCLVPSPGDAPRSSLSRMMGFAVEAFGTPGSAFLAHPDGAPDLDAVREALGEAAAAGEPCLVMGTAFAWVHLLDGLEASGPTRALPPGSRAMETGGFKGRSRVVSRTELYGRMETTLGIPAARVVNEYGMTELQSQMYEPVLPGSDTGGASAPPPGERRHRPPPWLRIRAVDPDTLVPRGPGERGLLAFFDLANLGSVSAILTEDMGVVHDDGRLTLEGRAPGAEPRGCSLALDDLLDGGGP